MASFEQYKEVKAAVLIKSALDRLFAPGDIFEVRIPKTRVGTISGYFDDTAIAASIIAKENGKYPGIYVTANPVNPALIARNHNKFEFGCHTTTNDAEIVSRRWFLIDLDPIRAAGISSTAGELRMARDRATDIVDWLTSLGWPEPVIASSGNGYHIMYRVDEPNDEATRVEFEFATKMLGGIFSDDKVEVDSTVWNASRIWKLYGTVAAKGSSTDDRPHRVAMIEQYPKELANVPRGLIENVARPLKESKSDEYRDMTGEFIGDMQKWLMDRGLTVTSGPRPLYGNEGKKWTISRCPFNPQHQNPMVGLVSNRPVFRCLHNTCSAFRWKEFREKIDPNYKDPDTIYQRLKEWCEGDEEEADSELLESSARTGKKLESILARLKKEVPRARFLLIEELLKQKRREFIRDTIGENNEKGNLVGLINRTRALQAEGTVPPYWIADYDHRIRVGQIGDITAERLSEADEIALLVKFHSMGDSWVKQTHCGQVIRHIAGEYKVNPLRVMFKAMRWDGTKRLDTWLPDYLGTKDNIYTRAIGRKWMISAVARGMDPGCQADHMLILEGKQGIGKSKALRILGGAFYSEYSGGVKGGIGHKDMVAVIIGKLIVEMSELATIKKADMESMKAMLTTTVDDARLSYERDAKSYPRTCVWAGTTNSENDPYIMDMTGARRFWPTVAGEVKPPDCELLREARDQLWAEAMEAYESGEDWWTVPVEEVTMEQADRQVNIESFDPWYEIVRRSLTDAEAHQNKVWIAGEEYVKGSPTGGITVRAGALSTILGIVVGLDAERQGTAEANRIRTILRIIGFKKIRPQGGWFDSSYAYELRREACSHLWPAVESAYAKSKMGFMARQDEKSGG